MSVAFPILIITKRTIYMFSPSTYIPKLIFIFNTFLC